MQRSGFRFDVREASGALGDLGTLLPLMLGAIAVAGLAPTPVLAGFGVAYVATALAYRLPVPVQPMKAIAAVLLVTEVTPGALAASGVMIGAVMLLLGATGWIDKLARLVPQSVLAGLQLGLGLALALVAFRLMAEAPALALGALALLAGLMFLTALPAALIVIALAVLLGWLAGVETVQSPVRDAAAAGAQGWPDVSRAFADLAVPQLSLTLTNAVVLTSLVAGDLFGEGARRVTPRRLSVSTGLMNLALTPFGAMPMCHGAGGLAAHHRFGARTGGAPLMLGVALILLALLPGSSELRLLAAIPQAVLGAMLLVAAVQLAWSRRLVDCVPSCRPVIAVTAGATLFLGPFAALVAGTAGEILRKALIRRGRRSTR